MKTSVTDVSETQKTLAIEIPSEVVDAEIARVARDYVKRVRVPGFRPGKVPATIVKQRFRDEILHDVMHGLVPRAVEEAIEAQGLDPVDTPDVRDVSLVEGQPLTFTAAVETVPPVDPGDLSTLRVTRPPVAVTDEMVGRTIERLRERAAKHETVEGRPAADGDTIVADIERQEPDGSTDRQEDVSLDLGATTTPPGFDAQVSGMEVGERKTFSVTFPESHPAPELAGREVTFSVRVKAIRRRVLPALDDEFAKDVGEFESLEALRGQVRRDLEAEAEEHVRRQMRSEVLRQLAARVPFEPPPSLIEREIERRMEELARQLLQQRIDPRESGIDWGEFRESQRQAARDAVASALALDALARREQLAVAPEEVAQEVERLSARAGRTPAAVRAQLERDGSLARLVSGLRRERAVDLALSHATITTG